MSTLTVQTISNGTVSTSSANVIQGSAKAWVNFNGTGTVAIRASYNVSSITDNGTGDYTVNFTNALPDANYSFNLNATRSSLGTANDAISFLGATPTTTALRISTTTGSGTLQDALFTTVSVFD
jgi:hypothetical protein